MIEIKNVTKNYGDKVALKNVSFNVEDGENCINDILNFVYEIEKCDDFSLLPEHTKLQKIIKEQLLNGKEFYLGLGVLRW